MGNNYWIHPPFFWRHLVPQNVGNIIFGCYFLNIGLGPKKVNGLAICSKNQFRDYFIRNRLEKLVPLNWNFAPHNLKNRKKPTNLFSNLDFLPKSEFPKILDLFMDFQGFPTPWISHPMDFGFSGRPRERPTKTKIGRQGRISRLPKGKSVRWFR